MIKAKKQTKQNVKNININAFQYQFKESFNKVGKLL